MSETKTLLEVFTGLYSRYTAQRDTSYSDITQSTRVTPLCIVSNDLRNYEHTTMIMQTSLNVVTAYYMQALPMVANVGGVDVKRILGRLASSAPPQMSKQWTGFEHSAACEYGLPTGNMLEHLQYSEETAVSDLKDNISKAKTQLAGLNAIKGGNTASRRGIQKKKDNLQRSIKTMTGDLLKLTKEKNKNKQEMGRAPKQKKQKVHAYTTATSKVAKDMEMSSLAVGKLVEVKLQTQNGEVTIPVSIMLQSSFVTPSIATAMMASHNADSTMRERAYKRKSGRISTTDFLLAGDLIKKRKQLMIQDDAGLLEEIQKRRRNGRWNAYASGASQVGASNNVIIVSRDVIKRVEREHRGRITNQRVRNRIFEDMGIMVMVIVDKEEEFVTFYYRNVRLPTDIPIKSLKRVSDKNGPDIGDILKSLMQGNSATF